MYAVILRVDLLIMVLYYTGAGCVLFLTGKAVAGIGCIVGLAVCTLLFRETYRDRTRIVSTLFNLSFLVLMAACAVLFGNDVIMYNFFYVQILLLYALDYMSFRRKAVCACVLLLLRLVINEYTNIYAPYYTLTANEFVFWRMMHILVFCAILIATVSISTQDFREMQSKLVSYNKKLLNIADLDPLTGLRNRRGAMEYIREHVEKYRAGEYHGLSIAIGDIDFFKKVNDTYGHNSGDVALKTLANLFDNFMSDKGLVSRWGGEEFLFIFCSANGDEAAVMLSELRGQIHKIQFRFEGECVRLTMTFGLAEYDLRRDVEATIGEADEKLYIGKGKGRDIVIY